MTPAETNPSGSNADRRDRPAQLPPQVAAVFDAIPAMPRARLMEIRALIFAAAEATQTAPLTETLKWGEPAYLPARKHGTTIRLGWKPAEPGVVALHVHCQTDLVSRWRQLYPVEFTYRDNRAVVVPVTGDVPQSALQQMAAMALTYHRDKHPRARP